MKGPVHSISSSDADALPQAAGGLSGGCPHHDGTARAACPAGDNAPVAATADIDDADDADPVVRQTLAWVRQAVIGLNFCPFANAVLRKQRLRIRVSTDTDTAALLDTLRAELQRLHDTPAEQIETSLLVTTEMLADFLDFNDFLDQAEALLHDMGLEGIFQIASFHPHYRFAGSADDDIENATNQSPWPTLHLLRESSIDRAVAAWGDDTDRIYENNMARLRTLGRHGWQRLQARWQPDGHPLACSDTDTPPSSSR